MKLLFLTVAIFSLTGSLCFAETPPSWLLKPEKDFPSKEYLREIGEGSSVNAAKSAALAALSLYFDTRVETVTQAVKRMDSVLAEGSETFSKSQSIAQVSKISSSAEFFCVNFTDPYYDKKRDKYFSLACINKKEAAGVYKARIAAASEAVESLYSRAKKEPDFFLKAAALQKAKAFSVVGERYIKMETLLVPSDSSSYQETLKEFSRLDSEILSLKKDLTFSIQMNQKEKKYDPIFSTVASVAEKRGFSYSLSNANYKIVIDLSFVEEDYDAGPFVRSNVDILIVSKSGSGVYSYSKAYPRTGSKTMDMAYSRAVFKINQDLEENFLANF